MAHHEGNRGPDQWYFDQMLLGIFDALLDGIRNFAGLTQTYPDVAGSITYYNQRPVAKATSTLDHLRDTGDLDDCFFQVQPVRVNFRHVLPFLPRPALKVESSLAGAKGERGNATMINVTTTIKYDPLNACRFGPLADQLADGPCLLYPPVRDDTLE
jgi:hypothetical protein